MEHAKRMILIPEGGGMRLESHPTVQTPGNPLSRLDSELSGILHAKNFENEEKKWLAYQQILEKYLQKNGVYGSVASETPKQFEQKKIVQEEEKEEDKRKQENFDISALLQNVRKTYRSQSKQLAEFIQRTSNVRWTKSGRVVIDGVEMPDSNIVDLINDATRFRKTSAIPNGRAQLATALRKAGVPRKLIGNKHFWDDANLSAINLSTHNVASSSPKDTIKQGTPVSPQNSSISPFTSAFASPSDNDNKYNRKTWLSWKSV